MCFVHVVYSCVLMSHMYTQENTQEVQSVSKGTVVSWPQVKSNQTSQDSVSPLAAGNHENNGQFLWADRYHNSFIYVRFKNKYCMQSNKKTTPPQKILHNHDHVF